MGTVALPTTVESIVYEEAVIVCVKMAWPLGPIENQGSPFDTPIDVVDVVPAPNPPKKNGVPWKAYNHVPSWFMAIC